MMPTDLASMAPAGRDMTAPESDFASVVEPTWYERSARPNHCTLPGTETSAHAAMKRPVARQRHRRDRAPTAPSAPKDGVQTENDPGR